MYKVSIVVLNYLNYQDTIECVHSALELKYPVNGIVVVDNGSNNESYKYLKREFKNCKNVYVIKSAKNLGFAKGNNIGINFARKKLHADFVLAVNNDTIFEDKDYVHTMLAHYEEGVGVLGSKIILNDRKEQPPMVAYLGIKDCMHRWINRLSLQYGSSFDFSTNEGVSEEILHGCALMFTPDFFEKYSGFYPHTFLYEEEYILYLMCKAKQLRLVYVSDTWIYHKEDQSSLMSFQNKNEVQNKYFLQSEKYVIWWKIRSELETHIKKAES